MEKIGNSFSIAENSAVLCKCDWFQAVFNNVSMDFILNDFLELDLPSFDDVFSTMFERSLGYDSHIAFSYNGIMISTRAENVISTDSSIFLHTYDSIQCSVSGSGLDYLRSIGKNVDLIIHRVPEKDSDGSPLWHVTRCDFAFDFINYKADFYKECKCFLDSLGASNVRLSGICKPIKYSIRSGGERTIYLGSNRSEQLMRIYDKLLEQTDSKTGLLKTHPVDFEIHSWIRIELQTRSSRAYTFLYGAQSYSDILYFIFEKYSFIGDDGKRVDFWQNLFDWEYIRAVIQNAYYTKIQPTKDSVQRSIERSIPKIAASIMADGGSFFFSALVRYFASLQVDNQLGGFRSRALAFNVSILSDQTDFYHLPGADVFTDGYRPYLCIKPGILPGFDISLGSLYSNLSLVSKG